MKRTGIIVISMMLIYTGFSQKHLFESKEIQRAYKKETRSRDGVPGENYWQNQVAYNLKTDFNPPSRILKGSGNISYTNNSPDTLKYLVIKLLPNIHKKGNARDYAVGAEHLNEGMIIDSMAINNNAQDMDDHRKFREYGSNLYVIFDKSEHIAPHATQEFYVQWNYEVIMHGVRNGGFTDSAFFIGYWYPQIAVYDDVYGWDREDYTGKQETYNDLGIYEVEINVPEDYLVWATGDQLNETDIFSEHTLKLINESRKSAETVNIINSESYANNEVFKRNHSKSWKFRAENVPDFAWACSKYFIWDANALMLENDKNREVWINAVYPPNSETFDKVADVAHQSIDYLSNVFPAVPFPYNKHITFNGIYHIAVEYPMMANNSDHASEEMYTELTIHEIAHNYIPFYMLSNERKHAWIDEGWVKLIGELYGESTGLKREDKKALNTITAYERGAGSSNDLPLIVPSGFMTVGHNYYHSYAKAANANIFLMKLMEEKGVGNLLKEFLLTWKDKHPTPYDFFNFMNSLCGEDLSWFWNPWYFEFSSPDLGIKRSSDDNEVLVVNQGGIPLPVELTITYNNEDEKIIEKSIWSWATGSNQIAISIPDLKEVKMITLGAPYIPDMNDSNNTLDLRDEELGSL